MKVGILTFSKENNYGANLQCYALCKTLQEMGHDIFVIDIQLKHDDNNWRSTIKRYIETYFFRIFRQKYFPKFSKKYNNSEEIQKNPPVADLFVVGSDQVWNPDITKKLDPKLFFFSFIPESVKRISYAASFGVRSWKWPDVEEIKTLLHRFYAISVRETSGMDICKEVFNINANKVLDPVLLRNSYDEICGSYDENKETNYIVYFTFSHNPEYEKIISTFAKSKGLRAVHLKGNRHSRMKIKPFATVKGWLNTIRYARFIVTGSFHCTAFCIFFHKQFISLPSSSIDRSERKISLLQELGLQNRYLRDGESLKDKLNQFINLEINYKDVDSILEEKKQDSISFLKKAIE